MVTTRLYLDIDGVLNATYAHKKWGMENSTAYVTPKYNNFGKLRGVWSASYSYLMSWSPALIEALNALDVEIVWLTTWREDARAVGASMGLKEASRVLHPVSGETTFPSIEWKRVAIAADLEASPTDTAVWIDDESNPLSYDAVLSDVLIIAPDPNFGISPDQIRAVQKYIEFKKGAENADATE